LKGTLNLILALVSVGVAHAQPVPGTIVYSQNLTTDINVAKAVGNPYLPNDLLLVPYTGPATSVTGVPQYELLISGVALLYNPGTTAVNVDIVLVNSSPLCGTPYGTGVWGPGRVLTVTVQPNSYLPVYISVVDWVETGQQSAAHLQYRNATGPLTVKANSYMDIVFAPAPSNTGLASNVSNTPNQGPPNQPENCPVE
jgi:hypothetical protein